jgi:hypothetical protein
MVKVFIQFLTLLKSRYSAGIRTGRSGFFGLIYGGGWEFVSSPPRPERPPIYLVPGALSLGVKRPGRKADHSPPSSAEVKE